MVVGKLFNPDRKYILYPPRADRNLFGAPPHLSGGSTVSFVLFLEDDSGKIDHRKDLFEAPLPTSILVIRRRIEIKQPYWNA